MTSSATTQTWRPGDIGATHGRAIVDRLIQTGERWHGAPRMDAHWNHNFVVTDAQGGTIEALGRGVVRSNVSKHGEQINLGCPATVDRIKVVSFVEHHLGAKYDYFDDVLLGIDCITHLQLHEHSKAWICSELAASALMFGGMILPKNPALMMPSDVVALLQPQDVKGPPPAGGPSARRSS